jgi:hypothetical protein
MNRVGWAAGLAAAALLAATGGTAIADRETFDDEQGNVAASVDIHHVTVVNGSATHHSVKIVVLQRDLRGGDAIDVWIDTLPANPGPEYRAGLKANTDAFGLLKVRTWSSRGHIVKAPRLIARSDATVPGDRSVLIIPRRALGDPSAIRMSVRVLRHTPHGWVRDWAPTWHKFYDWVGETS